MITLGQRVTHAIDAVGRGEYEFALEDVAVAIDISAQTGTLCSLEEI